MSLTERATTTRVPALDEEPEIVKFVRTDALQYEGKWDPDEYDPDSARATMESHLDDAVEAERLGMDGMLLTEHHFDGWTLVPSPNVYLAAVAMRTSRLRLGQAVHVLPIHSPWRLAEETGMLDVLSNGRAEVGVGKGNFSIERIRYNPPGDNFDQRFEEGLELLTRALRETNMTFDGTYNKIPLPATVYPRPYNPNLRVWCAGLRPESIEYIARKGQNLYGFMTPDAGENFKRYTDAAHQAGHERSGANFMVIVSLIIAPTDAEAQRLQQRALEVSWEAMMARNLPLEEAEFYRPVFGGAIVGSPQTVLDQLGPAFESTGSRRLNLVFRLRAMPEDVARQTQYLFATEIMPQLRHLSPSKV
jgi:alkanesulfonate monooxygenase SsuD/methylene tetrahydromethanopterin reductase-like flavin-dependent oxidoreductase (luciferase family)